MYIFEVMIKSIINSIILFEQLKFQIAQIDQNGVNLTKQIQWTLVINNTDI